MEATFEIFDLLRDDIIEALGRRATAIKRAADIPPEARQIAAETLAGIVLAALRTHLAREEQVDQQGQVAAIIIALHQQVEIDRALGIVHHVHIGAPQ